MLNIHIEFRIPNSDRVVSCFYFELFCVCNQGAGVDLPYIFLTFLLATSLRACFRSFACELASLKLEARTAYPLKSVD